VLTSRDVSSLVIDSLCDQARRQNFSVACFYFDFAAHNEQSPANTMGALLKQVVGGLEEIPVEISQAYQDQKKAIGGRGPWLPDIVKMLQTTTSKECTFICIDALDECVPEHQAKLLGSLSQILRESPGTRIFVTGRPHIGPEIGRRLGGRVTSLSICPKRGDIVTYLRSKLEEDTTPDAMDSRLEADILRKIPEDISEMYVEATALGKLPQASANRYISRFLLVSLNIDAVLQETTIHRRRQKLSSMTDGVGLGDAYGTTLGRIKAQGGEKARLGMAALMWISHAERPLKADELCHALAVEIGSPGLDTDNIPSIGTLLACSQGLVAVDKEASTVRLVHFTLQEYLQAHPDLSGAAHSTIAEICLSYLNSPQVKGISASSSLELQGTPFLEYSSLYWGVHAKKDLSDCSKQLALRLFCDYNNHVSVKILLEAQRPYCYDVDFDKISLFSGLHCASFFGIAEIVAGLVEIEGCDINQMDCGGNTPLMWAAHNGHEGAVKVLLGRDNVNPDKPDDRGRTPLHHASKRGHEGVVKILLERDDVNPNKPDKSGRTPLYCAAENGRGGVVEILLGRDEVDPGKPDTFNITPLSCAVGYGHEEVVKILLGRSEVDPDKPDMFDRTPLNFAATGGHEGVVKILLGRDNVTPDIPDRNGQTPLSTAARYGHEGVVKILLERDEVSPDKPDNDGQTPLWWASLNGREGVVKILLERDEVNSDKSDDSGGTPLFISAFRGHDGVVRTLLARGVNPDKPDNDGQTPLWCASSNGHEGVVRILLERDEVNPDKPDNLGRTPLFAAACSGREGVVKTLLARGVNPDKPNINGRTPFYNAAWNGREGVVKILLSRNDVNPNKLDKDGKTPLDRATDGCHKGVIALLQPPESAAPSLS